MTAPVKIGDVIDNKYKVEGILGEGGMGVVVAAMHLELELRVALKFLLPEAFSNLEAVQRFVREARAAAKIRSEHVARIIDTGRLEDGSPFQVMELLDGEDLSKVLATRGAVAVEDAVSYVLQASEALAEAHAAGIVHRDLKPANLFLARRPDRTTILKVLDFGISKNLLSTENALTRSNAIVGSPFYMSPEQLTYGREIDARSDIWSLGIILYELLSGTPPFGGETLPQVVAGILQNKPRTVGDLRPGLPPALGAAINRCMMTEPSERFASVAELAHALAPYGPPSARESAERISRVLNHSHVPSALGPTMADPLTNPGLGARGESSAPGVPGGAAAMSNGGLSGTGAPWSRTGGSPATSSPGMTSPRPVNVAAAVILGVGTLAVAATVLGLLFHFTHQPVSGTSAAPDVGAPLPSVTVASTGASTGSSTSTASPLPPPTAASSTPSLAPGASSATAAAAVTVDAGATAAAASPNSPSHPTETHSDSETLKRRPPTSNQKDLTRTKDILQ